MTSPTEALIKHAPIIEVGKHVYVRVEKSNVPMLVYAMTPRWSKDPAQAPPVKHPGHGVPGRPVRGLGQEWVRIRRALKEWEADQ